MLFGAAGNIQNNLLDYALDRQKGQFVDFDKVRYKKIYLLLIILSVLLSIFLSIYVKSGYLFVELMAFPILLYWYNYRLKKYPLIGNLIVAFLSTFSIFLGLFYFSSTYIWHKYHSIFAFYFVMAFLLSLMRELVKDMEDAPIDKQFNYLTLPIMSMDVAKWFYAFYVILFIFVFYHYWSLFNKASVIYLSLLTWLPVIFSIRLLQKKLYTKLTKLLKLVMVLGILSLLLW